MEMAIGKIAVCLILNTAAWTQQFPVRHQHLRKFCAGTLTVEASGIRFSGPKGHTWGWPYADIQQLTLHRGSIHILSYKDSSGWKLGKDVAYTFTGEFPIELLERQWSATLDQRFVAAVTIEGSTGSSALSIPVKQLALIKGTQGTLTFGGNAVVYDTPISPRTWRYSDIQFISSANPFQLSITTLEKQFDFQLKQAINESTYNQLWLDIEKRNGRIQ
jgi:hypothetical protein